MINDSLQNLLAKHDAIASSRPLPVEALPLAPGPSTPTVPQTTASKRSQDEEEEEEEDDEFSQLARRYFQASALVCSHSLPQFMGVAYLDFAQENQGPDRSFSGCTHHGRRSGGLASQERRRVVSLFASYLCFSSTRPSCPS